jgi:hypothetical protein
VISNISVTYTKTAYLEVGQSLDFPAKFKLEFKGYLDNNYMEIGCPNPIEIEKVDNYRAIINFKAENTDQYEHIYLDQGPFMQGDRFILKGKIYEYYDLKSLDDNKYDVIIEDTLDGGKHTIRMDPATSTSATMIQTLSFENPDENDDKYSLDVDDDPLSTDVHLGEFSGLNLMLEDGDLFVVEHNNLGDINGNYIGILPEQIGTFDNFYMEGGKSYLYTIKENGTQDLNDDNNDNDILIIFRNPLDEYAAIDLYDRDHNESSSADYRQGIKAGSEEPSPTYQYDVGLKREEDTYILLPAGGTNIEIEWDDDLLTASVKICQPPDYVYPSIFVGTTEAMEIADATVTKDDEGTEKTIGCCSYLVKEFSMTSQDENIEVNRLIGNLVVPEYSANTNQNLVVVGGPSVNGLCNIMKEEINAATGKYIVKRDGKKLYVAGWEAADTTAAGNALTDWLYANMH